MHNKHRERFVALILTTLSIAVAFAILEGYFRWFHIQTNGINVTLSNEKWNKRYWKPINTDGFRDQEYTDKYLDGKKLIFVVGDSFVAGAGIEDIQQRFGNLIGKKLGDSYAVLNVAKRGWSTKDEVLSLNDCPYKPDIVVLSYYLNDIEGAAAKYNVSSSLVNNLYTINSQKTFFHDIRRRSYLVDFIYWRMVAASVEGMGSWWNWVRELYDIEQIWSSHARELDWVISYCEYNKAKLYVVIFPNLLDIPGSAKVTAKVQGFFSNKNIPTLNLADHLGSFHTSELIVNSADAHPSPFLHAWVADKIIQMIRNDYPIRSEK